MSIFDGQRLPAEKLGLDWEGIRRGVYSDKYFVNIAQLLQTLSQQGYTYAGKHGRLSPEQAAHARLGDAYVEMQWFTRRPGTTVVAGVDIALAILRGATGFWEGEQFISTAEALQVWAIEDGDVVTYHGDPQQVQPVLRVRGRYRDFGPLETVTLGYLTRASRVATNTYQILQASRGKPVLFFPARFDLPAVQALDGYAYALGVQRYNHDFGANVKPFISTDAQGAWWGGKGGGTTAHAYLACFLGDIPEAMLAFARTLPPEVPRIALVDFNNDCARDAVKVLEAMFAEYRRLKEAGKPEEAARFRLFGVRLDTSGDLRDQGLQPLGDPALDLGVNPRLVWQVREALDRAWEQWHLPPEWREEARRYCQDVKIVVSGGFKPEKIERFERLRVPVDFYGVGSWFYDNHGPTNTDFTADVVRVRLGDTWYDMAKIGRRACDNPNLRRVW
ncbi:MAG: nicotinate phosphoribosyltransferase [Chloroflexi bacterium]|nr:nicotinate phosphoribosyltransferase [Chloroflexota bacterium]